jgi:hypothetical protein
MIDDHQTCIRCGRLVDIDSDEFLYGEATPDGRYVCQRCLTGEEEGAIADDMAATEGALESAGLADPVAVEAMGKSELEMREELFAVLYDHESTEGRWAEPPEEEG